jgi:predicted TIM-barrel fold metal-dependent hydrolase
MDGTVASFDSTLVAHRPGVARRGELAVIIDAQIHIWDADRPDRPWPKSGSGGRTPHPQRDTPLTAIEVLEEMDRAGVAGAILIPPSWEGERNDLALAAAQKWPNRFAVMGRIADDAPAEAVEEVARQPGMLGLRIILAPETAWASQGLTHPLWSAAASNNVPLMIAPVMHLALVADIVKNYPTLKITLDHLGTAYTPNIRSHWSQFDLTLALATAPNVSVKLTALPCYSERAYPWDDVVPYCQKLFAAYAAERLFWGSDLSRLPCPYGDLVQFFLTDIPWLKGRDLELVMGEALRTWLEWR